MRWRVLRIFDAHFAGGRSALMKEEERMVVRDPNWGVLWVALWLWYGYVGYAAVIVRRGYFDIPGLKLRFLHGPHPARVAAFTVTLRARLKVS
jgi:hypothetical protein